MAGQNGLGPQLIRGLILASFGLVALGGLDMAAAADTTGASTMLDTMLGNATSWSSRILVIMLIAGLAVIAMTHFADLRQVIAIPLVIAIIAGLVVYAPLIVQGVGLVFGATPVGEVVPTFPIGS